MKGDPEERAAAVGRYIVRSGATVRAAAAVFGVSKSTIWKDQARLKRVNPSLWSEVRAVVQKNKAERHLRGGEATRRKYADRIFAQKTPQVCGLPLAPIQKSQYNKGKFRATP